MIIEQILVEVCRTLELNVEDVKSGNRDRHREGRYIAIRLIREYTYQRYNKHITLTEIGKLFTIRGNNIKHSTVLHAIKKTKEWYQVDKNFRAKFDKCNIAIQNYLSGKSRYQSK